MSKQANWTKAPAPTALDHAKAAVVLLSEASKHPSEAPELYARAMHALCEAGDYALVEQAADFRARAAGEVRP